MPRSDWRLQLAAVGFIAFGVGAVATALTYAQHENQRVISRQRSGQQHETGPQQSDTDHAGVPALVERAISNPEPSSTPEREQRDLAAQENTAAWAFWMVLFSGAQLVVSGFGLWALLRTIAQGKRALKRARTANRISRQTAQLQLRAYLGVKDVEHKTTPGPDGQIKTHTFTMTWLNSGQTPAKNVQVQSDFVILTSAPDWLNPDFNIGYVPKARTLSNIGPNQAIVSGTVIETTAMQSAGQATLYIWSVVEYDDTFPGNPRRRSEMCSEVRFNGSVTGPKAPLAVNRHAGPLNGMDDTCFRKPGAQFQQRQ